jgi:hypothetical protein
MRNVRNDKVPAKGREGAETLLSAGLFVFILEFHKKVCQSFYSFYWHRIVD